MLKDDGVDPHGGLAYSRYERVRVERVFTESIDKENSLRQTSREMTGPPRFIMNCQNAQRLGSLLDVNHSHGRLEVVADKVQKASPSARDSMGVFDPNSYEVKQMKQAEKLPGNKHDLPCTRSQEIGWLLSKPASHSYIQHRRSKKLATGNDLVAESSCVQGAAMSSSPSANALAHSRSAPSLGSPSYTPLGSPVKGLDSMNSRRFRKPRTFCPITKYADTYMSLMHHDPFHQSATR